MRTEPRFKIGLKFTDRNGRENTITDIWKTYNDNGDLIRIEYRVSHSFLGQTITATVPDATIARRLTNEQLKELTA